PVASVYFYCSVHHPNLHSFPTRRSSDLVRFIYDGSTKRKTIVAIEDFDPRLKAVHLSDVKDLIGNPDREKEQEGNYYVTYSDEENYTVTLVFESAFDNPNPSLTMYILAKPRLELEQK